MCNKFIQYSRMSIDTSEIRPYLLDVNPNRRELRRAAKFFFLNESLVIVNPFILSDVFQSGACRWFGNENL
jgi:hypothetical protein